MKIVICRHNSIKIAWIVDGIVFSQNRKTFCIEMKIIIHLFSFTFVLHFNRKGVYMVITLIFNFFKKILSIQR